MRVTREQAAENRDRVLDTAARLFRERGFGGVGVAELMNEAGLTHGGFYGQFGSKDDLKAQACEHAAAQSIERWQRAAAKNPDEALAGLVAAYLSPSHRDNPGTGCSVAALAADAAREGPQVRAVVAQSVKNMLDTLADVVAGTTRARKRQRAAATLSSLVGAMVLARAVDDPALSNEILRSVKAAIARPEGEAQD